MDVDVEALKMLVATLVTSEIESHQDTCPAIDAVQALKAGQDEAHKLLESLNRWKLSLWSNGSGGPKGWLEIQQERTDKKFDLLFEEVSDLRATKLRAEGAATQADKDSEKAIQVADTKRSWWQTVVNVLAVAGGAYAFDIIKTAITSYAHH